MKHMLLFVITAMGLAAADATGRWSGSLVVSGDEGERSLPALLVLKQEGANLTGTAGPPEDQQSIENGKVENDVVTFELIRDGHRLRFTLKVTGEEIAGDVTREDQGQMQKAKFGAKREKS